MTGVHTLCGADVASSLIVHPCDELTAQRDATVVRWSPKSLP